MVIPKPPAPQTVIFRPFVWYLTLVLSAGMCSIGTTFIFWEPFRYSPIFQPARALTGGLSRDVGVHSLTLWGLVMICAGIALPWIFARRYWVVGWSGSIVAFVVCLFFTITLFEAVDTRPGQLVAGGLHAGDHPGLLSAQLFVILTLTLAGIVYATFDEHHRRNEGI